MAVQVGQATVQDGVTTWKVTKDGKEFLVKDTNKNGYFDNDDLVKGLNGNQSFLDADDMTSVHYQTKAQGVGLTAGESAAYSRYLNQNSQASQDVIYEAAPQKKRGFWGKVGHGMGVFFNGLGMAMPAIFSGLGVGLMGVGISKSIGKDPYSGLSYTMAGSSMMAMGQYASILNIMNNMTPNISTSTYYPTGITSSSGVYSSQSASSFSSLLNTSVPQAGVAAGTAPAAVSQTRSGGSADYNAVLNNLLENAGSEDLAKENADWLIENYKDKTDLDEATIKTAKMIAKYPTVNYKLIGDGPNQLDNLRLNDINKIEREYAKVEADNQHFILSEDEYAKFKDYLSNAPLDEAQYNDLIGLIDKALKEIRTQKKLKDEE